MSETLLWETWHRAGEETWPVSEVCGELSGNLPAHWSHHWEGALVPAVKICDIGSVAVRDSCEWSHQEVVWLVFCCVFWGLFCFVFSKAKGFLAFFSVYVIQVFFLKSAPTSKFELCL